MQKYTIYGARMTDREEAHIELAQSLQLPAHYGKNLDALWDVLGDMQGEIILKDAAKLINSLEVYGCKLIQTMFEAADKNPNLIFHLAE